jgi:LPS-assembly lipoprotein
MSKFRPRLLILLAAPVVASALLGGCAGFQPLYAAEGVAPKLAAIEVAEPDGRVGFLMHDYLTDSLAQERGRPAIYRLSYTNREMRLPRGINITNVATQYEVDLSTNYTLTEIATGKVVTRGTVSVNVTYAVQSQPYAALSEAQDGERRAAEQAADRLRLELATYFASPRPTPSAESVQPPPVNTYSDRLPGQVIQTPKEQAAGELRPQGGQADTLGQAHSLTTTPDTAPQPFTPSQDPNNIQTLPLTDGSSGQ